MLRFFFLVCFISLILIQYANDVEAAIADSSTIVVELKPRESVVFFYYDKNYLQKMLRFYNNTKTTIKKAQKVQLDKPIELTYKMINQTVHGLDRVYKHFYLSQGDSVSFSLDNGSPKLLNGNKRNLFIEEAVNLNDIFFSKKLKFETAQELKKYLTELKVKYDQDILLPSHFFKKTAVNEQVKEYWKAVIESDYYLQYFNCINMNPDLKPLIDDDVSAMLNNVVERIEDLQQVRYNGMFELGCAIIFHLNKGDSKTNFNEGVAFALANLKEVALPVLLATMKNIPEIGSNRYAESILTIKRYAENNNSSQMQVIETIINNKIVLPIQFRLSINDKSIKTFDIILRENKGKLIFIDFWASWCIPCRIETPILENVKRKYANKGIVFISISLDEDNKVDKWLSAMKQDGIYNTPHQYRLINAKKTEIAKIFNLRTIPKYVVLDRQGDILNKDFFKPSEKEFEKSLDLYLKLF